jgi:hypothetical protein
MRRRRIRQALEQIGYHGLAHLERHLGAVLVLENEQQLPRLFVIVALDELC